MSPAITRKTLIASGVALTFSAPSAEAALVTDIYGAYTWSTDSANLTLLSATGASRPATVAIPRPGGTVLPGTNDVTMHWDGNGYNSNSDYTGPGGVSNVTASSPTLLYNYNWVAHDIQVFTPGSYSFDTTLGGGNPEAGMLNVTVGAGQIGMHMLFDWNGNNNIDIFMVMSPNRVFGAGIGWSYAPAACEHTAEASVPATGAINNCLWDSANFGPDGKPAGNKVWMLTTVDGNGDGIMGINMAAGGPFANLNASFNTSMTPTARAVVPVPAAVWLFVSGLLGLFGVARRNKNC